MTSKTRTNVRNLTIYSLYLRNHGQFNTFNTLKEDLSTIQGMGFDSIWLMPIHSIGQEHKKGGLGCPYSIQDYNDINPEYGSEEDFIEFINEAHKHGIKVLIDVVYNHTSYDSRLYKERPDFFYKNSQGEITSKEPDWSDVIDLDFSNMQLWPALIESLKKWVSLGVDGFRCDVASMVPLDFWLRAREEIATINPETIWLAESVDTDFLATLRKKGFEVSDDAALYEAFDILYDYDIYHHFKAFVKGELSLGKYIQLVENQDALYPEHYCKLRFIENHDQVRFSSLRESTTDKINFTVLSYMLKGATMVYAGQETSDTHTPSLFDIDPINLGDRLPEYMTLIRKLNALVKNELFKTRDVTYEVLEEDLLLIRYEKDSLVTVINFAKEPKKVHLKLVGKYEEILTGIVHSEVGSLVVQDPLIFKKMMS